MFADIVSTLCFIVIIALIVLIAYRRHLLDDAEHQLGLAEQTVEYLTVQNTDLYGLVSTLERARDIDKRIHALVVETNAKLGTTVKSMTMTHDMLIAELEDRNKEIAHILLGAFTDDTPIPLVPADERDRTARTGSARTGPNPFVPADEVVKFPNGGKLTLVNEHPLWVHDDGTACPTVTFPSADFGGMCLRHGLPVHIQEDKADN